MAHVGHIRELLTEYHRAAMHYRLACDALWALDDLLDACEDHAVQTPALRELRPARQHLDAMVLHFESEQARITLQICALFPQHAG